MSLTRKQVDALLLGISPGRVLRDNKGMAHVSQQDVRATRVLETWVGGRRVWARDATGRP